MEDFMEKLALKIWPAEDRIGNVNGVYFYFYFYGVT